jgi:hypothetical protein
MEDSCWADQNSRRIVASIKKRKKKKKKKKKKEEEEEEKILLLLLLLSVYTFSSKLSTCKLHVFPPEGVSTLK